MPKPQDLKALERLRDALYIVARDGHKLADMVAQFESRHAHLPDPVNESLFYIPSTAESGRELDEDWELYKNELWRESNMLLIEAVFHLRTLIDDTIDVVRELGTVMSCDTEPLDKRWTTQAIGALRILRGSILNGHSRDLHPSCLPMIRSGVPESLRSTSHSILVCMEAVKSVLIDGVPKPRETATPALRSGDQIVLWAGAEPSQRNIEIARTCTAYLEANGNVKEALKALERDGFKRSKSTVYNHLNARAKADPDWLRRAMRSK